MRSKIGLAVALLLLVGVAGAQAFPMCSCSCLSSCTATCVGSGGLTSCGALGALCSTSPACGGGGCLSSEGVTTLLGRLLAQPGVVPVGGQQGRAAARLTWRLMQHVEERSLGQVYTANTGFVVSDGLGNVRAPELAFVSRERADAENAANAVTPASGYQRTSPNLVAEFVSPSKTAAAARQNAAIWLQAGTQAVLLIDAEEKTASLYRNAIAPEVAGAGSVIDLSDVVAGFSLRLNDLFE